MTVKNFLKTRARRLQVATCQPYTTRLQQLREMPECWTVVLRQTGLEPEPAHVHAIVDRHVTDQELLAAARPHTANSGLRGLQVAVSRTRWYRPWRCIHRSCLTRCRHR